MGSGTTEQTIAVVGRVLDGASSLLLIAVVWLLMLIPMSLVAGYAWVSDSLAGSRARG